MFNNKRDNGNSLVVSSELPPGDRLIISFQCRSSTHSIMINWSSLAFDQVSFRSLNGLQALKSALQRSLTKKCQCDDDTCFLYEITSRTVSEFSAQIWRTMTPKVQSLFSKKQFVQYQNRSRPCNTLLEISKKPPNSQKIIFEDCNHN